MRCIAQLTSPTLGVKLAEQATKNLLAASLLLSCSDTKNNNNNHSNPILAAENAAAASTTGTTTPLLLAVFYRATTAASFKGGQLAQQSILKWIGACSCKLPSTLLQLCLPPIAKLLHKLMAGGSDSPETSAMAEEVVEVLQGVLGVDAVSRALQEERGRGSAKKEKRAVEKARKKVLDPTGAAQDKRKRMDMKARGRKAQQMNFKEKRRAGGPR